MSWRMRVRRVSGELTELERLLELFLLLSLVQRRPKSQRAGRRGKVGDALGS